MQHTLKTTTEWMKGTGLHTGADVSLRILPAAPGTGILFVRTDLPSVNTYVPAAFDAVDTASSQLCTFLKNSAGVAVQTPEHLLAALSGCGIDNALIEISGSEVPLMDGSAKPFVDAILNVGRKAQPAPHAALKILKTIRVEDGDRFAELKPQDGAFSIDYTVDFPGIGRQQRRYIQDDAQGFASEVASARTFTLRSIAEKMKAAGAVKGGNLENALVLNDEDGSAWQGTKRYADEPVRHKIMDAVGDLSLAGMPIIGAFTCVKGGHALTNRLLRALFADPSSYKIVHDIAGIHVPERGESKASLPEQA
ncbi:MAG TPA: UDP-3-O-acyl-N-acetylglucosamine deacetylase [Alphaproteobacteria bacterium]